MEFEDFKKYADKMVESITTKVNKEEKEFFDMIIKSYNSKCERIVKTNDFIYYNLKFIDDNDLKQGCDIKSEVLEPLRDILEENKDTNNAYLEEFKDYMSLKQELNQYKDKIEYYENFEINKTIDKIRLKNNKEIKELHQKLDQYKNNWEELRRELMKKAESVRTIKNMPGDNAKVVNPHIEVLEQEYNYFLNKMKELEEDKHDNN